MMANKSTKAITPHDVARYGHIATLMRSEMAKRGWRMADLAERLGLERRATVPYPWMRGYGAPGPMLRPKLTKLLGVPESALTAREVGDQLPAVIEAGAGVLAPQARPQGARGGDPLLFRVLASGEAQIKLDLTLPLPQATPLLRMLLDAGIVFGGDGGEP
jgi:transcriptional regulator with XRE-family HTH domain